MSTNISGYDRADENANEVCPATNVNSLVLIACKSINLQIQPHPKAPLMQKHHISDNHWHDGLISSSTQATDDSSTNEAIVTGNSCLPDICENANQPANQNSRASTEDIAEWNDDEICVTQCYGGSSELCTTSALV
jgi:hypothetical protein